MVAKKRKSKRQTLQTKYKIQKRSKEHEKRVKKGILKKFSNKKKQVDSIPNAWPYKEDLLLQIKAAKEKMERIKQAKKEKQREERAKRKAQQKRMQNGDGDEDDMEEEEDIDDEEQDEPKNQLHNLGKDGVMATNHFETEEGYELGKDTVLGKNSRRAYLKELRKTVEGADVILQVLDARDPLGTASTAVQEMVIAKGTKKLVYILNKADLVPRDVLAGWLGYLRRSHPCVPFKSNTQTGQARNLGRAAGKIGKKEDSALKTNRAVGTEELLGLLKNYARVGDTKSQIVVGVVGFPNVGKSSLVNSLLRSRAVGVSAVPGFTKVAQEVILDKNIRLMDTPGIVFADGDTSATALRNCVNVEEMEDVMTPIQAILERCPQGYLMQLYGIPKFKAHDSTGFLALVARATGKLKKGGIPNIDQAARSVLHDWNAGKIRYYCKAPVMGAAHHTDEEEREAMVLTGFTEESDAVKDMRAEDVRVLDELEGMQTADAVAFVGMESVGEQVQMYDEDGNTTASADTSISRGQQRTAAMEESEEEEDEEEEQEHEQDETGSNKRARGNAAAAARQQSGEEEEDHQPEEDPRKASRKAAKAQRKASRRAGKGGSYDFKEYFN